jgi:hypothetical protein
VTVPVNCGRVHSGDEWVTKMLKHEPCLRFHVHASQGIMGGLASKGVRRLEDETEIPSDSSGTN